MRLKLKLKPFTQKNLKIIFVLILVFIVSGLCAIYFHKKFSSRTILINKLKIDSKASLVLNTMHQTSTKNGIKDWTLDASSAKLLRDKNKAVLEDVSIVFFMKQSQKIFLSSKHGTLDTKTHDMTFSDHVNAKFNGYTLQTDTLHYNEKRHIIYSMDHVRINNGHDSVIDGDSLTIDINKGKTIIKGNVKGVFSEKSDFFKNNL